MNIDLLFQIAGVGILIFAVNQVLQKAGREDIAVLASVAGLVVVQQCEEHLRFVLRRQG